MILPAGIIIGLGMWMGMGEDRDGHQKKRRSGTGHERVQDLRDVKVGTKTVDSCSGHLGQAKSPLTISQQCLLFSSSGLLRRSSVKDRLVNSGVVLEVRR